MQLKLLGILVVSLALAVACGSDSSSGTDTGGTDTGGTDMGGSDTGGSDTGGTDTGGSDTGGSEVCTPDCTDKDCGDDGCGDVCGTCTDPQTCSADGKCEDPVKPVDQCVNADDGAVIAADPDAPLAITGDCVVNLCLANPTIECVVDCVQNGSDKTDPPIVGIDLSDGCAACYGASSLCGVDKCLAECIADTSAPECGECLEANCLVDFYACSGLTPAADVDMCTNAEDMAVIAADPDAPLAITSDCVVNLCLANPTIECVVDCVQNGSDKTDPPIVGIDLSDGCAACYGASSLCGVDKCLAECIADTSAPECGECLEANCLVDFYACSGLTPTI